jgi:hypothetical protein
MLVTALTLVVATGAADQLSGTWKMNAEKSKYSPGPAPKSLTVVVESDENNYKIEATGTDGDGKPLHVQYTAKFDGKDHPATGIADADSVSVRRIDRNTVETLQKKDGKVVMTITSSTSKDGKHGRPRGVARMPKARTFTMSWCSTDSKRGETAPVPD